ncbi:SNF2-related protein [Massilia sp. LjRoot122]|uniref:DEAD/DEAH box helicase n=1 Tax=Massilia sp. LjRoot122 TaxID=3342257 RepID=UPI003ECE4B78
MDFTLDDIVRQFDPATYARGAAYDRQGAVLYVWDDEDVIEGEVAGSGANIYSQEIRVGADRHGVRFDGACTCPMNYNCKHVVAVLLAALRQPGDEPGSSLPAVAIPVAAERWLQQFATVQWAMQQSAAPASSQGHRLVYVLAPDQRDGALRLHLCKARLRKDGSIGGVTVNQDFYSLLANRPAYVRPCDDEPIRLVAAMRAGSAYVDSVKPAGPIGNRLLGRLCREGRLLWAGSNADLKRGSLFTVQAGPHRHASLDWRADASGNESVKLSWRFDDGASIAHVMATEPLCYLDQGLLGELALPERLAALAPAALLHLVEQAPHLAPEQRSPMARRLSEAGLDRILPVPQELHTRTRSGIAPTPCLVLDACATVVRGELRWHDYALLDFSYDGFVTEGSDAPLLRRIVGDTVELIERDAGAERAAAMILAELGFVSPGAHSPVAEWPGALQLPTQEGWVRFARHELPRLRVIGWEIEIKGDFRYDFTEVQDWYAELSEDGEGVNAWFDLELGILVDDRRYSLLPLLLEMIRKTPQDFSIGALATRDEGSDVVVELPNTMRVVLPWSRVKPILSTLIELHFSERMGSTLRLPVTDAARLAELEQAAQLRWMGGERLRELGRKLGDFGGVLQVEAPAGLQATLRPYQQAGLAWMQFLREYGFGGILADDMGLGKTIQTLAHILAEKEAGRLDLPALVVAPTSLMGNWQSETARFAPGLRVLLLHGKERAGQFDQIAGADLVLTTYPLLGRDEQALRSHRYHLLILDEAQYIKNKRSKAAQVACLLDARHRLCLTGTPVQNHLGELWSQFHFLMPGLLGDEKAFKAGFRKPIEQHGDMLRKDLLARRVRPFMLRRTKDKVATELPPKTEVVLPVEFGAAQRDLYETVRLAMDRKVRAEIERKGLARSQIVILDALLKLRQVCCDPRLLKSGSAETGSAKLVTLMDLLDTLLSEGRKVLVFSQFTSMLALVGKALQDRAVEFVTLTGDTVDREAPIASFQQGQVPVFLISLKAGGVGLNLTAADTVVHYDPWWNPASENQATDRAWRIGQEQPVFVYKLIVRGTLEERIQDMQRRKGELANALLDAEGGVSPAIGADDLQAVFAPMAS